MKMPSASDKFKLADLGKQLIDEQKAGQPEEIKKIKDLGLPADTEETILNAIAEAQALMPESSP